MANIISLVGRPNVGKSTFFNRLTGSRQAIVDPTAGVTRDRNYGKSDWNGIEFSVIDTGGYVVGSDDIFEAEIRKQCQLAIEESDVILFIVDGKEGLSPLDEEIGLLLRRSNKKVFVVVNKIDDPSSYSSIGEFYALGLDNVFPLSAANGSGSGDLLDEVVKNFTSETSDIPDDLPKITIVGRPNVGKSSIVNAFLGEDRHIVTPIAGTTRDAAYTHYNNFGFNFYLVDTAGLRKKSKVEENLEFYSVMRSIRAIENSDVCILMLDASQGFEEQDLNIFGLCQRNHKGVVVVVNKWDLVDKTSNTHLKFEENIRKRIAPFTDVPIIFTSVINKQRVYKVIETAIQVYQNRIRRISTSKLNEALLPIVSECPPPMFKDKVLRIKYVTQLKTVYPSFVFFANLPQYIRDPYKRYLENKIRNLWEFHGVPMEIYFRRK